jgi:hypothetical protein
MDDGTVYMFVHNEFHGEWQANASYCVSKQEKNCFYANQLAAISKNAGRSFSLQSLPHRRIAFATPWRYVADAGRQGMSNHLGVLASPQRDGYYYALVYGSWPQKQDAKTQQGTCLFRTADIADATSWRGWSGESWGVRSFNPYVDSVPWANTSAYLCSPVVGPLFRFGWTYNTALQQYLTVGYGKYSFDNGTTIPAVLYATSRDMIRWSDAQFLMPQDVRGSSLFAGQLMYPSFLDPASKGLNFEYTGRVFWLYGSVDTSFGQRNVFRWNVTVVAGTTLNEKAAGKEGGYR